MVGTSFGSSRSGRKTLREVRKLSEDPHPKSVSGKDTLREVRKWSGDPPGGPEVIGRPSGRSGSDRETLRKVRK